MHTFSRTTHFYVGHKSHAFHIRARSNCDSIWRHPQRYQQQPFLEQRNPFSSVLTSHITGYDEGGFSASISLPSFVNEYGLSPDSPRWKHDAAGLANVLSNINSFGVLGTAIGAGIALLVTDRFGRLRCWQGFVLLWASGLFIQIFASGILSLLYFARIWSGLGMGGLSVVAPLFLTEIASTKHRGMVISIFMVCLLAFLSLGRRLGVASHPSRFCISNPES